MMHKVWFLPAVLFLFSLWATGVAFGAKTGGSRSEKAILLVAFGTTVADAQKPFETIEARTRAAFPGVEIRWAFTSSTVRAKMAEQGKPVDSPEMALARLMNDGYPRVAVLSLHVVPGQEFHDLRHNASLFAEMSGGIETVAVARPLLSSTEDMRRVAKAVLARIPETRKAEDGVLFMGHGNKNHPSDAIYGAMNGLLQDLSSNVHMGTVEGYPSIDDLLPKLKGVKKVYLMPFMAVAGRHAQNDMAGDGPESWKSILTKNGFNCEVVLTGLTEYPEVVEVWLDHLKEAVAKLQ
ncbi:MAG: sirohydrochlorin cobaltochelatase [Acidobacteriota bacterium]